MSKKLKVYNLEEIEGRIFRLRGVQVMVDKDLADMYGVETKVLNQAVKRNSERFPKEFRFELTEAEYYNLRSQFVTSSENHGGRRYLPYAFTEQGVAMLSAVLRSSIAIQTSIQIMNAFVQMRKTIGNYTGLMQRMNQVELQQADHNQKFEKVFRALETKEHLPKQGIFYDGQIFDAYIFITDIIKTAKRKIILIDNYIDETTLKLFAKRNKNINCTIYTKKITQLVKQDLEKYNAQYPAIFIKQYSKAHDRFLIIDKKDIYHIGASLKDLGKKWFAFSKMNLSPVDILQKIEK